MSFPIDIVIPWVDGGDPAWQKLHDSYTAGKTADNTEARYRDWGTLPFWFRGISRYAPWVRTVHFVTWGHLPPWLNLSCPKLHVVKHEDYIPSQYLPTFSSHTIELNLHRIPGLAEHFLYFNDDVFLAAPTTPEDFFHRACPGTARSSVSSKIPATAISCPISCSICWRSSTPILTSAP